jgi:RNA polymerase-interacting CarD/CdnL/TRCF family regulator
MKNMLKTNNAHVVKQLYRHNKQKERPETEAPWHIAMLHRN